jgi:hypothetical protein
MARGRQTRKLRPDQVQRLEQFKRAAHDGAPHGYSLPQLKLAMTLGCSWETLQKALQGLPVWDQHHSHIAQWIERYLPAPPAPMDGKSAASGERDEANKDTEAAGTDGSVRGQG